MAFEFRLPDIGEGIHEGEIVKWFVKAGDTIGEDDILCEVQNDKAVVEIPSPVAGKVEEVVVGEGTVATVGQVLIRIDAPGYEDLKFKGDHEDEPKAEEKTESQVQATAEAGQSVDKEATPVAKEQAPEKESVESTKDAKKQKHSQRQKKIQTVELLRCLRFVNLHVIMKWKFLKLMVQVKMVAS